MYDGQKYDLDFDEFFTEKFPQLDKYVDISISSVGKGTTIMAGNKTALFSLYVKNDVNVEELTDYLELKFDKTGDPIVPMDYRG